MTYPTYKPYPPEPAPLHLRINELGMTKPVVNCLMADGIHTLGDLVKKTRYGVMKIPGLGKTRVGYIEECLKILGLKLKEKA